MKTRISLCFCILLLMICSIRLSVYASNESVENATDSTLTLDTEHGLIEYVRFEIVNENVLQVILDYTNTTEKTASPIAKYTVSVFQNGVQLPPAISIHKPDDCSYGAMQVKPGYTMRYCEEFQLSDSSNVEIEISPLLDISDDIKAVSEISLSKDKIDEFISAIEPTLKKSFDSNYNITRTDDAAFIYFWFDGMRDVFIRAKVGDSKCIEIYENSKSSWQEVSSDTYDILKQYDQNAHLVMILANDKQTDKALLMYLDGELYFDSIAEKEE